MLLSLFVSVVYYFYPAFISDFLTLTPADGESMLGAFSHKIPMILFLIVAATLLFFSLTKKLSLIPILGLLSCLYLMTELGITNWLRFGLWLLAGLVIYALYGYRNSKLNSRPPLETT